MSAQGWLESMSTGMAKIFNPKSSEFMTTARTPLLSEMDLVDEKTKALRTQQAPILYPGRGGIAAQQAAMLELQRDLESKAPLKLKQWWAKEPEGKLVAEAKVAVVPRTRSSPRRLASYRL